MISTLELARICGVSQGTVDRALHNRPGIGKETRERILAAAREHGYQPHPAARELLTGERRLVGAIIPTNNSVFFVDLMNAIHAEIAPAGFRFFLTPVTGPDEFLHILRDFAARRSRAILFVPPEDDIPIPDAVTAGGPTLVSLVNPWKGRAASLSRFERDPFAADAGTAEEGTGKAPIFLGPDEVRTGRDAVAYLAGKGHQRILHLTYARQAHGIESRARGYAAAMEERGLTPAILKPLESESFRQALKQYRPTALFCHNDWLALSAMRLLEAQGLKIPGDISVLGVDNSPTFVELCPGITTLSYPAADIARAIREILTLGAPSAPIPPCTVVERTTVRLVSG
jgi:LacI family transcriptional regulator